MGKVMQEKGVIRSGVDWFSHHFKRIFKRDPKEDSPATNLEQLYRKYDQQSKKTTETSKTNATYTYRKKSQVLEITLQRLRSKNLPQSSQHPLLHNSQRLTQGIKEETLQKLANSERPFDLNCPICLQVFILPVPTVCGHTFCSRCIEDSLLHKPGCPVCRSHLRTFELSICLSVKTLIGIYYDRMNNTEERDNFDQRLKDGEQWESKRRINADKLVEGEKLDVRDTEYIWCVGSVLKIYRVDNKVTELLVHYLGWNKIYDEIIDFKSPRLAPFGFYSTRKEIPRYASSENEQNYYSYVITGTQQEQQQLQQQDQNNPIQGPGVIIINEESNDNSQPNEESANNQPAPEGQQGQFLIQNMQQLIENLEASDVNILHEIMDIFHTYERLQENEPVSEEENQEREPEVQNEADNSNTFGSVMEQEMEMEIPPVPPAINPPSTNSPPTTHTNPSPNHQS